MRSEMRGWGTSFRPRVSGPGIGRRFPPAPQSPDARPAGSCRVGDAFLFLQPYNLHVSHTTRATHQSARTPTATSNDRAAAIDLSNFQTYSPCPQSFDLDHRHESDRARLRHPLLACRSASAYVGRSHGPGQHHRCEFVPVSNCDATSGTKPCDVSDHSSKKATRP